MSKELKRDILILLGVFIIALTIEYLLIKYTDIFLGGSLMIIPTLIGIFYISNKYDI